MAERETIVAQRSKPVVDADRVREELHRLAGEWRQVLAGSPMDARPIVSQLLNGRVRFLPVGRGRWEMTGQGTLAGLFTRELFPVGMASPRGIALMWTPTFQGEAQVAA